MRGLLLGGKTRFCSECVSVCGGRLESMRGPLETAAKMEQIDPFLAGAALQMEPA